MPSTIKNVVFLVACYGLIVAICRSYLFVLQQSVYIFAKTEIRFGVILAMNYICVTLLVLGPWGSIKVTKTLLISNARRQKSMEELIVVGPNQFTEELKLKLTNMLILKYWFRFTNI